MVIGLTVVSFATSAPELLVSVQAALKNSPEIAIGNVVGSNIANIGLVLGITAIIAPLFIDRDFFRLNWPVMLGFSALLYYFMYTGNEISRIEGLIFITLLMIYLFYLIKRSRGSKGNVPAEVDENLQEVSYFKIIVWLFIGGLGLYFGSELLVKGAVNLAETLGVSNRVIAITMIAVGTSIPELAASVISAFKGEKALSLGNLIGSNIFNIAAVLGITATILPIPINSPEILSQDMVWMIGVSVILLPLSFIAPKMNLSRYKGFLLFAFYLSFIYLVAF
ncbi:sodium:calcium antiporter [Psychroflexus salis]|uniref:Sodium:calcium antiporter n=2 Tax=Psychroflexus salis TaxID=1526574 RepID=A0A916ZW10_9FLAO|nr:sodium:calcium antiporter [Psychroflexus salis]